MKQTALLKRKFEARKMKPKDGGTVLVTSRTKGREAVSHFSCAWTSFPTGRKHEDKALSQKKK